MVIAVLSKDEKFLIFKHSRNSCNDSQNAIGVMTDARLKNK
jgi:hypothetical protein